ncbi:MAG TPA: thioesterase family protein [Myxococcota bacterium]
MSARDTASAAEPTPTPFAREMIVKPEWIDPNGHMNIAHYVVAFDLASDDFCEHVGVGWNAMRETGNSTFVLGMNLDYRRELFEGDPLRITTQLLDWDPKRLHIFHQMHHATRGFLAATNEVLFAHVCLTRRRSVPLPEAAQAALARVASAHASLGVPEGAFRRLEIRRR